MKALKKKLFFSIYYQQRLPNLCPVPTKFSEFQASQASFFLVLTEPAAAVVILLLHLA
jgi:hypothetical protein